MFSTQFQQVLHSQFNLLASFKTFFYAEFFWPRTGDTFEAKECLKARNGAESFGRVLADVFLHFFLHFPGPRFLGLHFLHVFCI